MQTSSQASPRDVAVLIDNGFQEGTLSQKPDATVDKSCGPMSSKDVPSQVRLDSVPGARSADRQPISKPSGRTESQNSVPGECTFHNIEMRTLSDLEKDELIGRLQEDFQKITLEFGSLTSSLRRSLRDRGITPKEIADCLMDVDATSLLRTFWNMSNY